MAVSIGNDEVGSSILPRGTTKSLILLIIFNAYIFVFNLNARIMRAYSSNFVTLAMCVGEK